MAILEKQIQMEEIDRGIVAREQAQNKEEQEEVKMQDEERVENIEK